MAVKKNSEEKTYEREVRSNVFLKKESHLMKMIEIHVENDPDATQSQKYHNITWIL